MDEETKIVLRKLMKLIVGNSERLLGMVAQFDTDDKGYLTEKDLVSSPPTRSQLTTTRPLPTTFTDVPSHLNSPQIDFINFFVEGSEESGMKGAAKAIIIAATATGSKVTSDNVYTLVKDVLTGHER